MHLDKRQYARGGIFRGQTLIRGVIRWLKQWRLDIKEMSNNNDKFISGLRTLTLSSSKKVITVFKGSFLPDSRAGPSLKGLKDSLI